MALSRDYDAILLWEQAKRDLGDVEGVPRWERFDLTSRAVQTVAGQFYDLMSNSYMTESTIVVSTAGKYETGSTGTYTVATKTLALQTPSADITSADEGKLVMFRISTSIYIAVIDTVATTSSFSVLGDSLPSSGGTLAAVLIAGTTVTADTVSLSSLRIMRTGAQIKLELKSSTSGATVRPATTREIDGFRSTGSNRMLILWALNGDSLTLAHGDSVSYGTLTLRYPRVPYMLTLDTDHIDLPDGVPIELAILYLKGLIQQRLNMPKDPAQEAKMYNLVTQMYKTFVGEVNAEEVKTKMMVLK